MIGRNENVATARRIKRGLKRCTVLKCWDFFIFIFALHQILIVWVIK